MFEGPEKKFQKHIADYGSDSRDEIFKALREEIGRRPLWSIIRTGLSKTSIDFFKTEVPAKYRDFFKNIKEFVVLRYYVSTTSCN